jgi:hypothetical protein
MVKSYDLSLVVCTVGGIAISGYGESDAIQLEWDEDIVTVTPTADGQNIYSRNNNRGLSVTITLSQKSRSHLLLAGLLETQHGDNLGIHPPVILPLPFFMLDPSTGESFTSLHAVFVSRPAPAKGKTIGDVVYKLHLPSPTVTPAVANVI